MKSYCKLFWALFGCTILLCRASLQAAPLPRFHERLTWSGSARARFILEYWAQSRTVKGHALPTECVLRTRLTRVLGGHRQVWQGQDIFTDPVYATIEIAFAIRVEGQATPQILVQHETHPVYPTP